MPDIFPNPPVSPIRLKNSPPPYATDVSPINPFGVESEDDGSTEQDEVLVRNTRSNANCTPSDIPGELSSNSPYKSDGGENQNAARPENIPPKPHLDVDAFKRLLLTGEKRNPDPNIPSTPPIHVHAQQNFADNSSNTDTSSISRHSIFEPLPEIQADMTPRTSHEVSDDDRLRLVGAERTKPPARTPLDGKPVKGTSNTPQTVSFTDPTFSMLDTAAGSTRPARHSPPKLFRVATDLNKPLPPSPATALTDHKQRVADLLDHTDHEEPVSPAWQTITAQLKRAPPPPPLPRRQSQRRTLEKSSSLGASKAVAGEILGESKSQIQSTPNDDLKSPPPPPPPRRRTGFSTGQASPTNQLAGSTIPISDMASAAHKSPTFSPALPPSRSPPPSSIKRPTRVFTSPGSGTMPPPPPPRRRGSSQSSFSAPRLSGEIGRTSTERYRSDSGASSSQLNPAEVAETPFAEKDIIADLSALQREVDELRGKFGER